MSAAPSSRPGCLSRTMCGTPTRQTVSDILTSTTLAAGAFSALKFALEVSNPYYLAASTLGGALLPRLVSGRFNIIHFSARAPLSGKQEVLYKKQVNDIYHSGWSIPIENGSDEEDSKHNQPPLQHHSSEAQIRTDDSHVDPDVGFERFNDSDVLVEVDPPSSGSGRDPLLQKGSRSDSVHAVPASAQQPYQPAGSGFKGSSADLLKSVHVRLPPGLQATVAKTGPGTYHDDPMAAYTRTSGQVHFRDPKKLVENAK